MASFNIHLAVANRYLDKNDITNEKEFYNGIIDPDLDEYEDTLHYTDKNRNKEILKSYLQGKVLLTEFLAENDINSDYTKGVFLHLITDYIFFTDFFDPAYLENISYNDFVKDLHYSYDYTNDYLLDKYGIDLSDFNEKLNSNINKDKKDKNTLDVTGNNILHEDRLAIFIERVSDVDLEAYRNKLLTNKRNLLPD